MMACLPMDIVCMHQFWWIDFMYLFVKYEDRTFLTTQHKSKRLCKHCAEVLAKLETGYGKARRDTTMD